MKKFFIAFGFVSLLTYCGSTDADRAVDYLAAEMKNENKIFVLKKK